MNAEPEHLEAEDWVPVGQYPTLREADEHGLVILAMGEACRVTVESPGAFTLQAEALPATRIGDELALYGQEATPPTPRQPAASGTHPTPGWGIAAIWAAVLIVVFSRQGIDPSLVERGASSSVGLIGRGEWWRPFTSLFLHADLPHLAGNLASGTIFGTLVSRSLSPLRGWMLILGCGALGNALTAWLVYPQEFQSIGASTAVFAALGILSGLGAMEALRDRARLSWARIAAPVLAGVVLLGWLGGANGGNTDVLGHVFGFSSGLVGGVFAGGFEAKRHRA